MLSFPAMGQSLEISVPPGPWKHLSEEDKTSFLRLRQHFHQMQKTIKDHCSSSFSQEISSVIKYIDSSPNSRENRCAVAGLAIAGPFIAVNTRQLMSFLGRCKSSINGSLQNLGYQSLRSKTKARECVLSILPSFEKDASLLRQWTVRCATENAKTCFCSSFPHGRLPTITTADLIEEKARSKAPVQMRPPIMPPYHPIMPPSQPPIPVSDYGFQSMPEMTQSYSVEYFPSIPEPDLSIESTESYQMTHSTSTYFPDSFDWSWDK